MPLDLLAEILRWRLAKPDCDRGVVVDGIDCRLVALAGGRGGTGKKAMGRRSVVAKAVAAAMPSSILLVLQFKGNEQG